MIAARMRGFAWLVHGLHRSLRGLVWTALYPIVATTWWNYKVPQASQAWAKADNDYPILVEIFRRYHITTVLDVGCGAGRLFPLYAAEGIAAVGTDISARALALGREQFPAVPTIRASLATVSPNALPRVDLVISNRVLQHIPSQYIARAVTTIAHVTDLVYLNETTCAEGGPSLSDRSFLLCHDYGRLFGSLGFGQYAHGYIGRQAWTLLGRSPSADERRESHRTEV